MKKDEMSVKLGALIKAKLKERKITVNTLAELIQVHPMSIYRWTSGMRTMSFAEFIKIMTILKISAADIKSLDTKQ